jgi:hypothetical protein
VFGTTQNQYPRIADTLSILCVLQLGLQSAPNLQYFAPKAGPRKSDSKQDFITYDFSRKSVDLKFPLKRPSHLHSKLIRTLTCVP